MIEAMKQALEALYPISHNSTDDYRGQADKAIASLRKAIAKLESQEPVATIRTWHKGGDQHAELWEWELGLSRLSDGEHKLYTTPQPVPQSEPVAYVVTTEVHGQMCSFIHRSDLTELLPDGQLLYTHPPQRTWVGLTIDEREQIQQECFGKVPHHVVFAHATEAKLKQKNGFAEEKNT